MFQPSLFLAAVKVKCEASGVFFFLVNCISGGSFLISVLLFFFFLLPLQKKVNPDLQVEVKPSIRARKIQEEKMRKQMQKEEYWRRREEEERWRMEMRYSNVIVSFLSMLFKEERCSICIMMYPHHLGLLRNTASETDVLQREDTMGVELKQELRSEFLKRLRTTSRQSLYTDG